MVAEIAEGDLTLARNTDFTTEDPPKLRREMQREHEEIAREFQIVRQEFGETPVYPDSSPYAAKPGDLIVCQGVDLVVRPPVDAVDGDSFVVVRTSTGNITTASDAGAFVQGAASDVLNIPGMKRYKLAFGGWWTFV